MKKWGGAGAGAGAGAGEPRGLQDHPQPGARIRECRQVRMTK